MAYSSFGFCPAMLSEVKLQLLDLTNSFTAPCLLRVNSVISQGLEFSGSSCLHRICPLFREGVFKVTVSGDAALAVLRNDSPELCRTQSLQLSDSSLWSCTDDLRCPACSFLLRLYLSSSSAARALHQGIHVYFLITVASVIPIFMV